MNVFRTAGAILFDPRTLIPFLLASLCLSVLGNSVYQICMDALGKNFPAVKLAFLSGALFIVMILIMSLFIGKVPREKFLPGKQSPKQFPRLILLVGREDVCKKAMSYHLKASVLKDCRLICSSETLELAKKIKADNPAVCTSEPVIVNDVNDPLDFHTTISKVLNSLSEEERTQTICDYTGMTAHASIGMFWASHESGAKLQYTPARFDENLRPVEPLEPIEILVGASRK